MKLPCWVAKALICHKPTWNITKLQPQGHCPVRLYDYDKVILPVNESAEPGTVLLHGCVGSGHDSHVEKITIRVLNMVVIWTMYPGCLMHDGVVGQRMAALGSWSH